MFREVRVFLRPYSLGGFGGGGTIARGQSVNGGTHEGGHRPYGGPNFDRLYHNLKVLLQLHDAIDRLRFY